MAELSFTIAKKLQKPQKGAPGITLRSVLCSGEENYMIVLAAEYGFIRERVRNAEGLHYRVMGKSLRVSADSAQLLASFARDIAFNSEEALDVFEFLDEAYKEGEYRIERIELEPGSFSAYCKKEFEDAEGSEGEQSGEPDAEQVAGPSESVREAFYTELSARLEKYDMGIIK